MRDLYTHTEADAGAWDRHHLEADDYSDAPSPSEAADETVTTTEADKDKDYGDPPF